MRSTRSAPGMPTAIHRIALHVLRDPDDANDAAQESLVKLVRRVGQFRGESQFSTWLHRLVVNTCKDVAQARWAGRAAHRAARSRTRASRATATPHARSPPPRLGASSARCLAELPRGAGDGRRAQGRVRRAVRRDLCRDRPARRDGEVLRAPRPQRPAGAALRVTRRVVHGQGGDRGGPAAPRPDAAPRRGARARPGRARRRAQDGHRGGLRGPLSRATRSCRA